MLVKSMARNLAAKAFRINCFATAWPAGDGCGASRGGPRLADRHGATATAPVQYGRKML
jgi:hypothetical protein